MRVAVIIPAAGSGSRFGSDLPKQFHPLGGQSLLHHVVGRFVDDERVQSVIVAVHENQHERVRSEIGLERVRVVTGGSSRQESVSFAFARTDEAELIAVHDAVRPFFRQSTFHAVLDAALEVGAALPALPLTETIHAVRGDEIESTLDRSSLVAAQTPQCFRREILGDILGRAATEGLHATDEAGLAVRFGYRVRVIPGDAMNLKITRAEDLDVARRYFSEWSET